RLEGGQQHGGDEADGDRQVARAEDALVTGGRDGLRDGGGFGPDGFGGGRGDRGQVGGGVEQRGHGRMLRHSPGGFPPITPSAPSRARYARPDGVYRRRITRGGAKGWGSCGSGARPWTSSRPRPDSRPSIGPWTSPGCSRRPASSEVGLLTARQRNRCSR